MRKIRFWWLFSALVMAVVFVGAVFVISLQWQEEERRGEEGETLQLSLPQDSVLQLPSLPLNPQTMNDAQREAAIEQAGKDAFAAALASGQNEENASNAAMRARMTARNIFYPTPP